MTVNTKLSESVRYCGGHLNISYTVSSLITRALNRKTSLDYCNFKIGSKTLIKFSTGQGIVAKMNGKQVPSLLQNCQMR